MIKLEFKKSANFIKIKAIIAWRISPELFDVK